MSNRSFDDTNKSASRLKQNTSTIDLSNQEQSTFKISKIILKITSEVTSHKEADLDKSRAEDYKL